MSRRIISGAAAVPAAVLFIYWGGLPFFLLTAGIMTAALLEYYSMCLESGLPVLRKWGILVSFIIICSAFFLSGYAPFGERGGLQSLIFTFTVLITFPFFLFIKDFSHAFAGYSATLTGIFYIGWLFTHAVLLREIRPFGMEFTLTAAVCTWAADTGAYYAGNKFGRRPLHPLSPNKTRAGALGAVLSAMTLAVILKHFLGLYFISAFSALMLGAGIGIAAVLGDLTESMLKRNLSRKDSGSFLPGHGGVLDRIDSMLFTLPVVYYYALWALR